MLTYCAEGVWAWHAHCTTVQLVPAHLHVLRYKLVHAKGELCVGRNAGGVVLLRQPRDQLRCREVSNARCSHRTHAIITHPKHVGAALHSALHLSPLRTYATTPAKAANDIHVATAHHTRIPNIVHCTARQQRTSHCTPQTHTTQIRHHACARIPRTALDQRAANRPTMGSLTTGTRGSAPFTITPL